MRMYFVFSLALLNQSSNLAERIFLALYAVKIGVSPVMVGVLGAMFSVFPSLLAVLAGRLVDRVGSRYLLIGGTIGTSLGMLLPYFWPSFPSILLAALMSGFAQVFFNVSTQNLVGILSTPEDRTRNFSNYSLTNSGGALLGPLIAGFSTDHLSNANACLFLSAFCALPLFLLLWRRGPLEPKHAVSRNKHRVKAASRSGGAIEMLKNPDIRRTLYTGSLLNTGYNLYQFYMPVYAQSVGLSASVIGVIMATNSLAAFVVRGALPRLLSRWMEDRVLAWAFYVGAVSLLMIPTWNNAWMLGILSFSFGLGIGGGQPIVTMQMFENSAEGRSGEGIGLKMATNQFTKVVSPIAFGSVATAFGLVSMFWLNALLLALGGYVSRQREKSLTGTATGASAQPSGEARTRT